MLYFVFFVKVYLVVVYLNQFIFYLMCGDFFGSVSRYNLS